MSSIRVSSLAFAWPARPLLFDGVDLHLPPGWTGVVGPNGGGKTTLLRLLSGELSPLRGRLDVPAPVHRCAQEVDTLTEAIQQFAWGLLGLEPWRWQTLLDLDPAQVERWQSLSPGERKRWQIGAALASGARTLLLDEPTNHLDAQGRDRLLDALRAWEGVGLVVSHDRTFLDALTTTTLSVEPHRDGPVTLRRFPGPWSRARAAWAAEDAARLAELTALQDAARAARRTVQAAREKATRTESGRSARKLMRNPGDNEGRGMGAKTRAEWAAARASRTAALARNASEAARSAAEAAFVPDKPLGRSLFLGYVPSPRDPLLVRTGAPVSAGGRVLLRDVHLALGRTDKVHLAGANGSGKTTLLRALLTDAHLDEQHVLWLPQDLSSEDHARLLETLHGLEPAARGRTLQVVAALGIDPARLLLTTRPSPGEARKLALALGMGRHAWLLVLDEPTNHLDLPSIERLQEALAAWPGALLLVTHDPLLARATCTRRWRIDEGRVHDETLADQGATRSS